MTDPRPAPVPKLHVWAMVIVAAALLLRLAAADGALWLDEAWTVHAWLPKMQGLSDALLADALKHDNNHVLATMWLYLVGADAPVLIQRFFSVACGALMVGLCWPRAEQGPWGLLPMGLLAACFPLVIYGSEARGYAPALCCLLASLRLLSWARERSYQVPLWVPLLFGLVQGLGLLGHLIYVQALGGFGALVCWDALRRLRRPVLLLQWFGLPGAIVIALYLSRIKVLVPGGATGPGLGEVLLEIGAWWSGMPLIPLLAVPAGLLWLYFAAREVARDPGLGLCLLTTLVLVPTGLILINPNEGILYPRFFLPGFVLVLVHGGTAMLRDLQQRRWLLVSLVGLVFLFGQAHQFGCFLSRGMRGDLSPAIARMVETLGPRVPVAGLGGDLRMFYSSKEVQARHPEWQLQPIPERAAMTQEQGLPYILLCDDWHASRPGRPAHPFPEPSPRELRLRNGFYTLDAEFPFYGPSGLRFLLYRRVR